MPEGMGAVILMLQSIKYYLLMLFKHHHLNPVHDKIFWDLLKTVTVARLLQWIWAHIQRMFEPSPLGMQGTQV